MLADLGYIGDPHMLTPYKKPKNGVLGQAEKQFNSVQNMKRQVIERAFHRIKIFKVCQEWNRKDYEWHSLCFSVVCKITNVLFRNYPL